MSTVATSTCLSYLVCATPRSGSSFLCEVLSNTGVAGRPDDYFWNPPFWFADWGVTDFSGFADRLSVCPIASPSPQNLRAVVWLTIITGGAGAGPSASVKSRPRSNGIPIVLKYPGVTLRQLMGIFVSGGSTDGSVVSIGCVL